MHEPVGVEPACEGDALEAIAKRAENFEIRGGVAAAPQIMLMSESVEYQKG
ncbi:MAG: hypothetical protein WBF47_04340 [Xanthobacteraceae bacterium]